MKMDPPRLQQNTAGPGPGQCAESRNANRAPRKNVTRRSTSLARKGATPQKLAPKNLAPKNLARKNLARKNLVSTSVTYRRHRNRDRSRKWVVNPHPWHAWT